jgi:alkylated DNA nucleotide flippase Atl1
MLALDLFNTKYEQDLREGAVDDLEARRIDTLNDRMQDLLSRAREPAYQANPAALAALKKQFQQVKDERDSYYKVREAGIPGSVPVEKIPGKEDLLKGKGRSYYEDHPVTEISDQTVQNYKEKAWDEFAQGKDRRGAGIGRALDKQRGAFGHVKTTDQKKNSEPVDEYISMGSDKNYIEANPYKNYRIYVRKKPYGTTGMYTAHTEIDRKEFMGKGTSQEEAVQAVQDRIDFVLNAQRKVTGSSTIDFNVKFATDLLADSRQTFYAKLENINGESKLVIASPEIASDPELLAAGDFKRSALRNQPDEEGRATPLPGIPLTAKGLRSGDWIANGRYTVGKETQDRDGNRVFDLTYHSTAHTKSDKLRLNQPAFTLGTAREVDEEKNTLNQRLDRLKVQARREFPQVDSNQEALLLKLLDKEAQDDQANRRTDARQDAELRKNFVLDREQEDEIEDLQTQVGVKEHGGGIGPRQHWQDLMPEQTNTEDDDWYDDEDEDLRLRSGDYVRDQQDGEYGEVFRMQGDPYERRVRILDRDGKGWYIEPGRLTRVDPQDPDVQRYFGKQRVRDMDEMDKSQPSQERHGDRPLGAKGTTATPVAAKKVVKDLAMDLDQAFAKQKPVKKKGVAESAKPGEYYIHTVYFKDGTKKRVRVTSDEFDVVGYYTKRGQAVDHVDYDFQLHSDTTEGLKSTLAGAALAGAMALGGAGAAQAQSAASGLPNATTIIQQIQSGKIQNQNDLSAALGDNQTNRRVVWAMLQAKAGLPGHGADSVINALGGKSTAGAQQPGAQQPAKSAGQSGSIVQKPTDNFESRIKEDQDTSGVERAILNRIMVAHTDLLMQFGPDKVMQAAEEVAYNVGDVDEIGTSDVSAYVAQVKQILGAVS